MTKINASLNILANSLGKLDSKGRAKNAIAVAIQEINQEMNPLKVFSIHKLFTCRKSI